MAWSVSSSRRLAYPIGDAVGVCWIEEEKAQGKPDQDCEYRANRVKPYPPGSIIVLPGNTSHFHWAKSGEYVTQFRRSGRWGSNTSTPATIRARHREPLNAANRR